MRYLIGIDIGTSATKTILMDEEGNVAAQAVRDYPLYQPDNGWAEQAPEDWQQAALETLKQVVEQSGVNRGDIEGIGCPADARLCDVRRGRESHPALHCLL